MFDVQSVHCFGQSDHQETVPFWGSFIQGSKGSVLGLVRLILHTDLVKSFKIGPKYTGKNAASVIEQDAGYLMLDIGLTGRNSVFALSFQH